MEKDYIKSDRLFIVAGPCLAESEQMLQDVCGELHQICNEAELPLIFKASFKKANRTSIDSFVGIGDEVALSAIKKAGTMFGVPSLTDVHESHEVEFVSRYVDVLQIPAFLFRQTDLLAECAKTGKHINIKKGQFAAPTDMKNAVAKIKHFGNENAWVCERGTTFGYHDLVVDMRSLVEMKECGVPVVYDATHSVQKPSIGATSGGSPQFISSLARAAVAVGVDGVFFETHPNPQNAKSDAATQLPLQKSREFIFMLKEIDELSRIFR